MRDGQVGLAGQPNQRAEGPNEMFPGAAAAAKWGPFETAAPAQEWGRRPKPPKPPRGGGGGEVLINRSTYQVKLFYPSSETVLPVK
jgi:hypothetical protein